MKRDIDLLRDLLFQVEKTEWPDTGTNPWQTFSLSEISREMVNYHVRLMLERRFFYSPSIKLDGQNLSGNSVAKFLPDALTDDGHEFLESIRDPEVWEKTKTGARKIGSFGMDLGVTTFW